MTLKTAIEPTEDLELYLGYSRPNGKYTDYAELCRKLQTVKPGFDLDRVMTSPQMHIVSVRERNIVRAMAVLDHSAANGKLVFHLYYADDAATTRALMAEVDKVVNNGFPASNS